MERAVSTTMRARKVLYDDHTHAFFVESRVEALERQVATRAKLTDVLNRSHDSRLSYLKKKVDTEQDIFEKKNEREATFHRDQLKDHVAHLHVLHDVARAKLAGRRDSHLGAYGLGASRLDILPQIERSIRDSSPSARRRKKSRGIQSRRRAVQVFDRTQSTSALLRMKSQIKSRPTSDSVARVSTQLPLPPIAAQRSQHSEPNAADMVLSGPRVLHGYGKVAFDESRRGRESEAKADSVFITQEHF